MSDAPPRPSQAPPWFLQNLSVGTGNVLACGLRAPRAAGAGGSGLPSGADSPGCGGAGQAPHQGCPSGQRSKETTASPTGRTPAGPGCHQDGASQAWSPGGLPGGSGQAEERHTGDPCLERQSLALGCPAGQLASTATVARGGTVGPSAPGPAQHRAEQGHIPAAGSSIPREAPPGGGFQEPASLQPCSPPQGLGSPAGASLAGRQEAGLSPAVGEWSSGFPQRSRRWPGSPPPPARHVHTVQGSGGEAT